MLLQDRQAQPQVPRRGSYLQPAVQCLSSDEMLLHHNLKMDKKDLEDPKVLVHLWLQS